MAKSAIGSALGFVTTVTTRVMAGAKGNEEAVLALPEDTIKRLTDEFARQLVSATQAAKNVLTVVVDYSMSLPQMIAAGAYGYANPNITAEHFPIQASGTENVTIELVHYGWDMETDKVLKDLESKGMRPATLPELCAIEAAYPDKQREFPIVALGSVWQDPGGGRRVACLDSWGAGRGLGLGWTDLRWFGGCRFAAVRK